MAEDQAAVKKVRSRNKAEIKTKMRHSLINDRLRQAIKDFQNALDVVSGKKPKSKRLSPRQIDERLRKTATEMIASFNQHSIEGGLTAPADTHYLVDKAQRYLTEEMLPPISDISTVSDSITLTDTASAEVTRPVSQEARQELLNRTVEVDLALRAVEGLLGGIGHNSVGASEGPFAPEDTAQVREEIAILRREINAVAMNTDITRHAMEDLAAKSANSRKWLNRIVIGAVGAASTGIVSAVARDMYDDHKLAAWAWLTHALEQLVSTAQAVLPWLSL